MPVETNGSSNFPDGATQALRTVLRERVDRLARLLDMNAPSALIATEITMVFRRGCALWPELVGEFFAGWIREWEMSSAGICPECGGAQARPFAECDSCLDAADLEAIMADDQAGPERVEVDHAS